MLEHRPTEGYVIVSTHSPMSSRSCHWRDNIRV